MLKLLWLTQFYLQIFLLVTEEYDSYIIVSFVNATLVLSIGETVEEVTDSGFLGTTPTLSCHAMGSDALVQVYPDGIRHIRADKRVNEWKAPGKKTIVKCAVNQRQVVIALTGGELVYFEMDPVSWSMHSLLNNINRRVRVVSPSGDVTRVWCVAVHAVMGPRRRRACRPPGWLRAALGIFHSLAGVAQTMKAAKPCRGQTTFQCHKIM